MRENEELLKKYSVNGGEFKKVTRKGKGDKCSKNTQRERGCVESFKDDSKGTGDSESIKYDLKGGGGVESNRNKLTGGRGCSMVQRGLEGWGRVQRVSKKTRRAGEGVNSTIDSTGGKSFRQTLDKLERL